MTLAVPASWAVVRVVDAVGELVSVESTDDAPFSFHGVHLGMTPADVRARFDAAREGALRASLGDGGAYALELAGGAGTVRSARLEFHEGLLVAIRAELDPRDPLAGAQGRAVSGAAVRVMREGPNGSVALTILSRTCPTHADEVRSLLSDDPATLH